jgi:hypothetical protein
MANHSIKNYLLRIRRLNASVNLGISVNLHGRPHNVLVDDHLTVSDVMLPFVYFD